MIGVVAGDMRRSPLRTDRRAAASAVLASAKYTKPRDRLGFVSSALQNHAGQYLAIIYVRFDRGRSRSQLHDDGTTLARKRPGRYGLTSVHKMDSLDVV